MGQIQWKQIDTCLEEGGHFTGSFNVQGSITLNGNIVSSESASGAFTIDGDTATTVLCTNFCAPSIFYCSLTTETNLTANSNVTLGSDASDTVTINADIASNLVPSTTTLDIGTATDQWRNLYIDGTANIDCACADSADIDGGTIDGTTIGGSTCAAGTFTTATVTGNLSALALICAPNIGIGEDNSVVVLDSDGTLRTDEIDSRVWGSTLVDASGTPTAGHIPYFTDSNTITMDSGELFWDSTNNRLGIGTSSPTEALTVDGRTLITGSTSVLRFNHSQTQIYGTTSGGAGVNMFYDAAGSHFFTGSIVLRSNNYLTLRNIGEGDYAQIRNNGTGTDNILAFRTTTTERMRITESELVVNEFSSDYDFKVESNGNANMLFVDGGNDRVGIGTNTPITTLTVVGDISASGDYYVNTDSCVRSFSFASGFAGNGLKIQNGSTVSAELDDLTVRGTMRVYELLINQIRATNGSLFVSSTGKVDSVVDAGGGTFHLTFDTGSSSSEVGHGFAVNDLIRAQRFDRGNNTLFQSNLTVTAIQDTRVVTASLAASSYPPTASFEYVRIGNTTDTDRQGTVYITSDDSEAPFIDVVDEVAAHTDWNTAGKIKVRVGKLDGLSGTGFGDLSGYGLWASGSAYLEGGVNADFGNIGGFAITADAITGSNFYLSGSATGNDFFISSSNFNVKANGDITGSSVLFDGGKVGGFLITSESIQSDTATTQTETITYGQANNYPYVVVENFGDNGYTSGIERIRVTKLEVRGDFNQPDEKFLTIRVGDYNFGQLSATTDTETFETVFTGNVEVGTSDAIKVILEPSEDIDAAIGAMTNYWELKVTFQVDLVGNLYFSGSGEAYLANGQVKFNSDGQITSRDFLIERSRLFGDGSDGDLTVAISGEDGEYAVWYTGSLVVTGDDGASAGPNTLVSHANGRDLLTVQNNASSNLTLSLQNDVYFDNIILFNSSSHDLRINTNGYRIFVKNNFEIVDHLGQNIYLINWGANGNNGGNATGVTGGSAGSQTTPNQSTDNNFLRPRKGGAGGAGVNGYSGLSFDGGGSGGGGSAGSNGGIIMVYARNVKGFGTNTRIYANGGNGGNGGNGSNAT